MRITLLVLLIAALHNPCAAQEEVVPDTLDWRGYYPLEVGNAWEWETEALVGYFRLDSREIVGDTLLHDIMYFIQAEYRSVLESGTRFSEWDTTYVRYDSVRTRVVATSGQNGDEADYTCDLSAAFGSETWCPASGEPDSYVDGGYAENSYLVFDQDSIKYQARKMILNAGGGTNYYHGVGMLPMIGDGYQGGTRLTYVRIGGRTYGNRQVYVSTEDGPEKSRHELLVYPNPARDRISIVPPIGTRLSDFEVYNASGRQVKSIGPCFDLECAINTSALAPGMYLLRVRHGAEHYSSTTFVIVE